MTDGDNNNEPERAAEAARRYQEWAERGPLTLEEVWARWPQVELVIRSTEKNRDGAAYHRRLSLMPMVDLLYWICFYDVKRNWSECSRLLDKLLRRVQHVAPMYRSPKKRLFSGEALIRALGTGKAIVPDGTRQGGRAFDDEDDFKQQFVTAVDHIRRKPNTYGPRLSQDALLKRLPCRKSALHEWLGRVGEKSIHVPEATLENWRIAGRSRTDG